MIDCDKIIDSINVGIVTIDEHLCVCYMNNWFALHAKIDAKAAVGQSLSALFELSPEHIVSLRRHMKTTLVLQTPSFFTADSNGYLFPMKHAITTKSIFDFMQQDITLIPYDVAQKKVTLLVYDQTVLMEEKNKCHKESIELTRAIAVANETIQKLENAKTKLVKQQAIIYKQAHYDGLTSLANRTLLHQRLQLLIEEGFENSKKFGVLFWIWTVLKRSMIA